MANRRMIASDIFNDEFFCDLSQTERLLWIGIIAQCADDQGRLQDKPNFINSTIFPDDCLPIETINAGLEKFAGSEKVVRYSLGNKNIIQIIKWWTYQTPPWATPSKYPAPEGWTDRIKVHISGSVKVHMENWSCKGGFPNNINPVSNYVDKPFDKPFSRPINEMNLNELKRNEIKGVEEESSTSNPAAATPSFSGSKISDNFYISVWSKVTGMVSIPGSEFDKVTTAIDALHTIYPVESDLVEYMKKYFMDWKNRKRKDTNTPYSTSNCAWLYDLAIAGDPTQAEIPKRKSQPRMVTVVDPDCPICLGTGKHKKKLTNGLEVNAKCSCVHEAEEVGED